MPIFRVRATRCIEYETEVEAVNRTHACREADKIPFDDWKMTHDGATIEAVSDVGGTPDDR